MRRGFGLTPQILPNRQALLNFSVSTNEYSLCGPIGTFQDGRGGQETKA